MGEHLSVVAVIVATALSLSVAVFLGATCPVSAPGEGEGQEEEIQAEVEAETEIEELGEPEPEPIEGEPSGTTTISGQLMDTAGNPLAGTVMLTNLDNSNAEPVVITVGADGSYQAADLVPAVYSVHGDPQDLVKFFPTEERISIAAGRARRVDLVVSATVPDTAVFRGNTVCRACHRDKFNDWSTTFHSRSVQDQIGTEFDVRGWPPAVGTEIVLPFQVNAFSSAAAKVTVALLQSAQGEYSVRIGNRTFPVRGTIGGLNNWAQQYLTDNPESILDQSSKPGFLVLPIQRNQAADKGEGGWAAFNADNWWKQTETFEKKCAGCHVTGLQVTSNAEGIVTHFDYEELNVECEACHGPASEHIVDFGGLANDIINPGKLAPSTAQELCGQCHARGESTDPVGAYAYPWNDSLGGRFKVGETLQDFFSWTFQENRGSGFYWEVGNRYIAARRNYEQYVDHSQGVMNFLRCSQCHDAHGSENEHDLLLPISGSSPDDNLCLSCHPAVDNRGTVHAQRLLPMTDDPQTESVEKACAKCHMPATAVSGTFEEVSQDGVIKEGDISSHTYRTIRPEQDDRVDGSRVPDSCNHVECHTGSIFTVGGNSYDLIVDQVRSETKN